MRPDPGALPLRAEPIATEPSLLVVVVAGSAPEAGAEDGAEEGAAPDADTGAGAGAIPQRSQ